MFSFITKIFDFNEREIGSIRPAVVKINSLEPEFKKLSPAKLKEKTVGFRERLEKSEVLDQLLPEAFAAVREASSRTTGMRPIPRRRPREEADQEPHFFPNARE